MAERYNDISCYSAGLLIDYARRNGMADQAIFRGIDESPATLENELEWTDVATWSQLALNVERGLGRGPGSLRTIAEEITKADVRSFQVLFLKMAPISRLVGAIGHHIRSSVNRNLGFRIEVGQPGIADVYCSPVVPSRYSKQICDYNRGALLAVVRLKGYAKPELEELACCAYEGYNECHYRVHWDRRASLLPRLRSWLYCRISGQRAVIDTLEQRYRTLRRRYEHTHRMEEALRHSDARFRDVFDNILDVYYEATQDGRITEVSPSVESLTGFRRDELFGMRLTDICAVQADCELMLAQLEEHGHMEDYEIDIRHRDGHILTCSVMAARITDAAGMPYKLAGTIRDITPRKQHELAIKESAERQRMIVQNMPVMLAAFDDSGKAVAWNQECEKVTGYSAADVVGRANVPALLVPRKAKRARLASKVADRHTDVRNVEMDVVCKDGSRRTVLLSNISTSFPIPGWHIWTIGIDITDSKRAEQAVRESETKFRQLARTIEEVFWLCSPDWSRAFYVSPAFESVCGRPEGEFYDDPSVMFRMVEPADRDHVARHHDAVLGGAAPADVHCEYRIHLPDGTVRWVSARMYPVRHPSGEVFRLAGLLADITEQRKQAEEREAIEEQLHHAQKMDAVGQLAGGIAHDFNNQLAGIMGFAELLREELPSGSPLAEYADSILVGSQRAADLTAKLLAFARKGTYHRVPVDAHTVVAEVVSLLKHSIDKRIRLVHTETDSPAFAIGDPTQIQNAILNLGLNARDAMPEGGELSFAVETTHLDTAFCAAQPFEITPGRYVHIRVSDTGEGMSEEVCRHVFEPFFTTKAEGKGTGMGLASVYGTARAHHGAVTYETSVGAGSVFHLYLPMAPEPVDEQPARARTAVHGSATVLVIDDEPAFRDMAVTSLRSLGYHSAAYSDVKAAIEYFAHAWRDIDLVLLDLVMPELDGAEVFTALRKVDPGAKVLLCSGYSADGRTQELLDAGAVGLIQKPFRKHVLSEMIHRALNGRKKP